MYEKHLALTTKSWTIHVLESVPCYYKPMGRHRRKEKGTFRSRYGKQNMPNATSNYPSSEGKPTKNPENLLLLSLLDFGDRNYVLN